MKLPEDKTERAKILVLIAIGSLGVLYAVWELGVSKILNMQRENIAKTKEFKKDIRKANKEIKYVMRLQKKNSDTLLKISEYSNKYILHPRLGNYRLGATETIENYLKELEIAPVSLREISISEMIKLNSDYKNAIKSYILEVTLNCGYRDLILLLNKLENSNPLLCIAGLNITGQSRKNPENHLIRFNVQWPIWADQETPLKLKEQLEQEDELKKDELKKIDNE